MGSFNYVEQGAIFVTGVTVQLDWNMASPLMVITPAVLEETMNPNEWRSVPITITNGPTGGSVSDLKQANTLIASCDMVAADSFGCSLLNLKPTDLPYLAVPIAGLSDS